MTALPPEDGITPESPRYAVAGRLVQVNEMGKARFLFLRGDGGEMLQLYVKADNADAFAVAKELELGDFVGARGPLFKTRKDKRALKCEELRLLTKAIRPLPGKVLQEGARRHRRRAALSPALPRLHRASREGRGLPQARAHRHRASAASSTSAATSSARRACSCRPTAARRRARSRPTTTRSTSISSCASPPSSISSGSSSAASIASTRSDGSSATRAWIAPTTPSSRPSSSIRPTRPTKI